MLSHNFFSECLEHRGFITDVSGVQRPVLLTLNYIKYQTETISASVKPLSIDKVFDIKSLLRGDSTGSIKLTNIDNGPKTLLLHNAQLRSWNGHSAELNVGMFELGFSNDEIVSNYDITVQFSLTPSSVLENFASITYCHTGNITAEPFYPDEISTNFDCGSITAKQTYSYEDTSASDTKSTVQIRNASINCHIYKTLKTNTELIKEAAINELEDITKVLSLCCRKRVDWHSMTMWVSIIDEPNSFNEYIARRGFPNEEHPKNHSELIGHKHLINGGLETLVKNYRKSTIRNSVQRTITFLVSSYSVQTIETRYSKIIMALESFCDGYFKEHGAVDKIPSGKWKLVEKSLKLTLDELSNVDAAHICRIRSKLPELKNLTAADKIRFCCNDLSILTQDLWLTHGFDEGLGKALQQRNHLFHRANIDDPRELIDNSLRLQVLIERLILSHIQWPESATHLWYDEELSAINNL